MTQIYVVIGETGERSDRMTWLVEAYEYENAAKEHVLRATEKAKEWEVLRENTEDSYGNWPDNWNPWDTVAGYMDYTGISYHYEKVKFSGKKVY